MNAWGDEDPPAVEAPQRRPHRHLRARHLVPLGVVIALTGPLVSALGAQALGPMLIVLGLLIACFAGFGWVFERMGAWDDDPDRTSERRLIDVVRLANRNDGR